MFGQVGSCYPLYGAQQQSAVRDVRQETLVVMGNNARVVSWPAAFARQRLPAELPRLGSRHRGEGDEG